MTDAFPDSLPYDPAATLAALCRQLDPGLPIYLVIDPLSGDPSPVDANAVQNDPESCWETRQAAWQRDITAIVLNEKTDLNPTLHPYLVHLQGPQDPWLTHAVEQLYNDIAWELKRGMGGDGVVLWRWGGFVQSSHDAATVAQHLSALMRLRAESSQPLTYLRLADNRVLGWLAHVLGNATLQSHWGPIHQWVYQDIEGSVHHVQGPASAVADVDGLGTLPQYEAKGILMNKATWGQVSQGGIIHPARYLAWAQRLVDHAQRATRDAVVPRVLSYDHLQRALARTQALMASADNNTLTHAWQARMHDERDTVAACALFALHDHWLTRSRSAALLSHPDHVGMPLHTFAAALHKTLITEDQSHGHT